MQGLPYEPVLESLESIIDFSPLTVASEIPTLDAIALMARNTKSLLVKSESKLIGYLTQQDIVNLVAAGTELRNTTIVEVMQTPLPELKINQGNDLTPVISLLLESESKLFAVVDEQEDIVGTITPADFRIAIAQLERLSKKISDQEILENQLLQSQRMLQLIIDTIPQSIFWKDINSRFLGCNRKFAQMVGLESPIAVVGKTDYDLISNPETAEFYRAADAAVMAKNQPQYHVITPHQTEDRSQIWLETNKVPLLNIHGQVIGMLGVMEDVTERITAQQVLETSERSFRFLTEAIPQKVWIASATGEIQYVNQRTLDDFGCLPEEIIGKRWINWIHPHDLPTCLEKWQQSLTTGKNYEIEFRLWDKADATYRWHLVRALPLRDRQENIINWFGTSTDIHDRFTAEMKLRASEEKYQRITTISPVGIFRCDTQAKCTYINDRWCAMTGLTLTAATGLNWLETLHPEDRERVHQKWQESVQTNQPFRSEYRLLHANGQITWVLGQAIKEITNLEDTSYVGTFTDITNIKQLEAELAERVKLADFRAKIDTILTQSETLTTLMTGCTDAIVQHLDAAFARIWMLNPQTQTLELQVSSGIYTHINGCHSHIALGRLKIGLIAAEGKPHLTNCVQTDPRVNDKEWAKREGMVAFAGYPLIVEEEIIGVIAMFSRQPMTEPAFTALGIVAKEIAIGVKRKQIETALKASEERFRNLVEASSDAIWEINADGFYTYISPNIEEILGYQPQEIIGKTPFDLMPVEEAERIHKIFNPITVTRQPFKCLENINLHQDSSIVILETSGVPVFDPEGNFCGYRGINRDISVRKKEGEQLLKTQQQLQAILDNLPAVLYLLDSEHKYLLVNKEFEKISHLNQNEIIGKGVDDIWPPEIAAEFIKNLKQVMTIGSPTTVEEFAPHHDGLHTYLSTYFLIKNNAGINYAIGGISTDITEIKLVEKSLLRLQKAIESTSDAVSITDITGEVIYVNPAFQDIFDYTENQLNSCGGITATFRNQHLFTQVLHTVQKGQPWRGEVAMKTKNGENVQVDLRTDAITDTAGNIVYFVSIYTDITQKKIIEEGLRLRDRAMAASENGIVIADVSSADYPIIYVNPAFEHITGYSIADVLGKHFPLVEDIDINQSALEELNNAMATGKNCTVILRKYSENGILIWYELNISPVYDVYGCLTHYIGIQTDITERKQTETELLVSQQRWQYLLTSSPAVIYTSKPSDDFAATFMSDNVKSVAGYNANKFLQDPQFWLNQIHPHDVKDVITKLTTALAEKEYSLEYRFLHKDGTYRWVHDQGKVVSDEVGNALELVGYWADITSRKQLEQDLIVALEKEKELNELKSRFISMTSHEFRTPLSTILSSAELLEHYSYKWSQEKQLTHLQRIQTAVHRLTEMLDDILVGGKAEAGKLEYNPSVFDLVTYCHQLVEEVQLNKKDKNLIYFDCEYESLSCYMDDKLLRHILSNLFSNAIKYSTDDTVVEFTLTCESEHAIFKIIDQGIGIPPEDLPYLFESFYRAKNVGNIIGTGLGLAIVKKCVDIQQGEIDVTSQIGVGTKFTVKIPLKINHITINHNKSQ
jgi:PAS domain S-box-containing protein